MKLKDLTWSYSFVKRIFLCGFWFLIFFTQISKYFLQQFILYKKKSVQLLLPLLTDFDSYLKIPHLLCFLHLPQFFSKKPLKFH